MGFWLNVYDKEKQQKTGCYGEKVRRVLLLPVAAC
jgi:hypothetical protein